MISDKTKPSEPPADFWGNILQKAMLFLCRHPEGEGYGLVISKQSGVNRSATNYALRDFARLLRGDGSSVGKERGPPSPQGTDAIFRFLLEAGKRPVKPVNR